MVVAIVCGGVFGSAWLVADRCRLGARRPYPAPVPDIPCVRGPVGLGFGGSSISGVGGRHPTARGGPGRGG